MFEIIATLMKPEQDSAVDGSTKPTAGPALLTHQLAQHVDDRARNSPLLCPYSLNANTLSVVSEIGLICTQFETVSVRFVDHGMRLPAARESFSTTRHRNPRVTKLTNDCRTGENI